VSNFQTHFRSSKRGEHINKMGDEIISQIRRSKFLIADFTGHRGKVYFEAGLAMGLPVFWTCRRDDLDKLHFDMRSEVNVRLESKSEVGASKSHFRSTPNSRHLDELLDFVGMGQLRTHAVHQRAPSFDNIVGALLK
jgi:hypothetical protein